MQDDFPPRGSGFKGAAESPPAARWLHPGQLGPEWDWKAGTDQILLGGTDSRVFGFSDNRHLVTVAGSRAGKSSTVLIPNLRRYPGSVIALDPKGELTRQTAAARRKLGPVYVLDPFGDSGEPSASHNPFDELKAAKPEHMSADAAQFADALIVTDANAKDSHWTNAAKNLIRGISLHMLTAQGRPATLRELRRYLSADIATHEALFKEMVRSDAFNGAIANAGASFFGKLTAAPEEMQSVLSTAQEQTARLDDVAHVTDRSDFKLSDLKRAPTTLYLVLPGMRMGTHFRWLRLVVEQALAVMERTRVEPQFPVLFVLEEFAALGHLRSLETAAGFMAGFGVKLWSVLQDLSQLKTHYPNSWETFLGNAGVIQAFGNADLTTTDYLSKRIGGTTVIEAQDVRVGSADLSRGDLGRREHFRQVPLLASDEVTRYFARTTERQLVLVPEYPPIYMYRLAPEESV